MNKSGIAVWKGDQFLSTFTLRKYGNSRYKIDEAIKKSRREAWRDCLHGHELVVIERGAGHRPNVVNAQAWLRGYIAAICEGIGAVVREINVSEWRRVIREEQGISWPAGREEKKRLAQNLVKSIYGIKPSEDEADAVLIGRAAIRLGVLK
jgi:hypothetical protein